MNLISRAAPLRPDTFDADARTVELIWTAGAAVERYDWSTGEPFVEELAVDDKSIDLGRLNAGAPLLAMHGAHDLNSVIGVVERAWIDGGNGYAKVRFSERPEVAGIVGDVRDGIIRNVSVGYSVEQWETSRRGGKQVRRAVRWSPHEISLVTIPADAQAQVRAATHPPVLQGEATMAEETESSAVEAAPAPAVADPALAERTRIAGLEEPLTRAAAAGVSHTHIGAMRQRAIEEGWDANALRSNLFELMSGITQANERAAAAPAANIPPTAVSRQGMSYDDPAVISDAIATAMARKYRPDAKADGSGEKFREYREIANSQRPSDILFELAQARGERVSVRDRSKLIERAFHSTSDFPLLLSNAANKVLTAGYDVATPSYRRFMKKEPFRDFKAHSFITAGDFPQLLALNEGGEILMGTISEKREQITASTFARGLQVTRRMLVNDDLGAFMSLASMIGPRIADHENATAYALVNTASGDGPTLAEGSAAVFTTGRTNKAGTAAAINEATVQLGYNAMMAMTTLDGLKLNIQPRMIVVSLAKQWEAFKLQANVPATQISNVNTLAGRLDVVVDANIPGNRWYLFADPMSAPVYVYGYVGGNEGPMIREGQVVGYDAIRMDVIMDFAVGAVDYRGAYYNAGA